ncbi:DUF481 domain-containing protein [candidate division KSB1 bacterium]|nr:DUF481 domain-containing protein [candidate division KSB1 bacterium]
MLHVCYSTPSDSLLFKNGNALNGEIKSMNRGVLVLETDYSDSDFKIKWADIQYIATVSEFLVTLSDETKYYGTIKSSSESTVNITIINNKKIECGINDIVFLKPLEKELSDRISASIDVGFSLTKARNLHQLSSRSSVGYEARKWLTEATFNSLYSRQDDIEPTERTEGSLDFRYVLPRGWYSVATISLLSNTEQQLDLRMNAQIGQGRYIIRTNRFYWGAKLGVNRNSESYTSATEDRDSWEAHVGTELNLYDVGDFSLHINLIAYPGLTQRGRLRSDMNLDFKYDLPYDFYIKFGGTLNYDNQPAEDASQSDYVVQSGLGWEW